MHSSVRQNFVQYVTVWLADGPYQIAKCIVDLASGGNGSAHAGAAELVRVTKWCALRLRSTLTAASILGTRPATGRWGACKVDNHPCVILMF